MGDFELIRAICQDPNYQRNSALGTSMAHLSGMLRSIVPSADPDEAELLGGFWGLTGESIGAVWKVVLPLGECDLDWWLDRIATECSYSLTERMGVDFSLASSLFMDDMPGVGLATLDEDLERHFREFVKRHRKRLAGMGEDLVEAVSRFTASYLFCYQRIEDAAHSEDTDYEALRAALAECYAAQARLLGVVVDTWIKLRFVR